MNCGFRYLLSVLAFVLTIRCEKYEVKKVKDICTDYGYIVSTTSIKTYITYRPTCLIIFTGLLVVPISYKLSPNNPKSSQPGPSRAAGFSRPNSSRVTADEGLGLFGG